MNKIKLLAMLLTLGLIVSVSFNAYFVSQNLALSNQNNALATEFEIASILTQVQIQVTGEVHKIGKSVVYACEQLSAIGLEGDQARMVLSALAANSSFIIDAATADANNDLVTVEPNSYRYLEGTNIGKLDYLNTNFHAPIELIMSNVVPLVEGFEGIAISAPIFNTNRVFIGSVNVVFKPSDMLNASVAPAVDGTPYAMWAVQTNGLILFDSAHPDEAGLNLFSDPVFSQYPQTLATMHQIANDPSGRATYQYPVTLGSSQLVNKDAQWKTIGAYEKEWRLVIVRSTTP